MVKDTQKPTLDYVMVVVWFPICMILIILHVVPLFSVWANYIRKQIKLLFVCTEKIYRLVGMVAVPLQLFGIFFFYLMMWNLLVITGQFVVFIFIDILRNVATTLSKIILILAIFLYLRKAIQDFEDEYREFKSVTFDLCLERSKELEDKESRVIVKLKPYEPLYVETKDGEASIPRRIFYEICKVYRPYRKEVTVTFARLFVSVAMVIMIFALIIKFKIFEEFSEVGETMLTVGTVTLPSVLGMLKSQTHQSLSDKRRNSHIRIWLEKITTTRKVNLDLNKPTKRVISKC